MPHVVINSITGPGEVIIKVNANKLWSGATSKIPAGTKFRITEKSPIDLYAVGDKPHTESHLGTQYASLKQIDAGGQVATFNGPSGVYKVHYTVRA